MIVKVFQTLTTNMHTQEAAAAAAAATHSSKISLSLRSLFAEDTSLPGANYLQR